MKSLPEFILQLDWRGLKFVFLGKPISKSCPEHHQNEMMKDVSMSAGTPEMGFCYTMLKRTNRVDIWSSLVIQVQCFQGANSTSKTRPLQLGCSEKFAKVSLTPKKGNSF